LSSSRLFDLGKILRVPISYFFDDMAVRVSKQSRRELVAAFQERRGRATSSAGGGTLELVRAYYGIPDNVVRQKLVNLE